MHIPLLLTHQTQSQNGHPEKINHHVRSSGGDSQLLFRGDPANTLKQRSCLLAD
jgi:hypothetical protein